MSHSFRRLRTLTALVLSTFPAILSTLSCDSDVDRAGASANQSSGDDSASPPRWMRQPIASAALPTAPYRLAFKAQAGTMQRGAVQDLAFEYAARLYDTDDIITSFVNENGEQIDCIDMARQPSLRQPDGTFAAIVPPTTLDDEPTPGRVSEPEARQGEVCPDGTVERQRPDTLSFVRFVAQRQRPYTGGKVANLARGTEPMYVDNWYGSAPYALSSVGGYEHARATQVVTNQGMFATLAVYAPHVMTYPDGSTEHSISQLWLMGEHGTDCANATPTGTCESVEVGWNVDPAYYQNSKPNFFLFSTGDNYAGPKDCWVDGTSATCPHFVMVEPSNSPILPAHPLPASSKTSQHPENQEVDIKIRHDANSNWYVYANGTEVGYFAKGYLSCDAFDCVTVYWFSDNGLATRSNLIRYGGEVTNYNIGDGTGAASQTDVHSTTDMGTGEYASAASGSSPAAYQHHLLYYPSLPTSSGVQPTLDVTSSSTPTNPDNDYNHPGCYSLKNTGTPWPNWGTQEYIFFGGPGLNGTSCP